MYLLYTDESGEITNPNDKVLVVAGVAVHEEAVRPLAGEINGMLRRYVGKKLVDAGIELHGSPLRGGRDEWRPISQGKRLRLAEDVLTSIVTWEHESSGSK